MEKKTNENILYTIECNHKKLIKYNVLMFSVVEKGINYVNIKAFN